MHFVCRLGTPEGRVVEEIHESQDRGSLLKELERRGYYVFGLRQRGLSLAGLFSSGRRKVSKRDFLIYNRELAALLRAGLPLLQALDLMLERNSNPRFGSLLREVRERVKDGEDLSEAFAHFGDVFPPLYAATLKAGERSGELEQVIRRFIRYLRVVMVARRKAITALVYPLVLLVLSMIMVAVMALYVIPRFEDFYDALEVELPALTRTVLATSLFVRQNVLWLLLGSCAIGFGFYRWAVTPAGRYLVDRLKLRLPVVGPILHRFALSEYCRSLATLLSGGIPLVSALGVGTGAVGNHYVRRRLEPAIGLIREGNSFHDTLDKSGVVTDITIDMVKVGESTGALAEMLGEVSDFLDEEVEMRLERMLALIEPLMLVLMGGVVAVLLLAMYLPMFSAWEDMA